ncbi:MAG: CHAT domain-containing protein [bacterium]|nr:CHAT domain-containing protein [bacterium]
MTMGKLNSLLTTIVVILLLGCNSAKAAEPLDQELFGKIVQTRTITDGNQFGVVLFGTDHGVVSGEKLLVYRNDGDEFLEIGYARVDSLGSEFALMRFDPTTVDSMVIGDLVAMRARVVWPAKGLVSLNVAAFALNLSDLQMNPILDSSALIKNPAAANDDTLCTKLLAAIEEVFPHVKDLDDLKKIAEGGRFNGMTAFEAMKATTTVDVRNYLLYVRSFPAKYIGQTFRFAETYAAWVLSNAPISGWEVIETYPGLSKTARLAYLQEHKASLLEEDAFDTWYLAARHLHKIGQEDLAWQIIEIMEQASTLYNEETASNFYWAAKSDLHSWSGQNEEALQAITQAIATAGSDSINVSAAYHNRATIYESLEKWEQAIADFETALRWKGAFEDPMANHASASSLEGIGRCFLGMQEYEPSVVNLLVSLEVLAANADLEAVGSTARAYSILGDVYDAMGQYGKAIEAWRNGLKAAEKLGWATMMADALNDVSDGHWNLGELKEAVEARSQALALAREMDDEGKEALILINLAELQYRLGENRKSEASFEGAQAIYRKLDLAWDIADTYRRLGGYQEYRGDISAAIENYSIADSLFSEEGNISSLVDVRASLAAAMVQQGRHEMAENYFESAYNSSVEAGNRAKEAEILRDWGLALLKNRNPSGAKTKIRQSAELYEEINDLAGQSDSYRISCDILAVNEGATEQALALGEKALTIARNMPSKPHMAEALISIGNIQFNRGEIDKALENYREALTRFRETEDALGIARSHLALGELYSDLGKYSQARAEFVTSGQVAEKAEIEGPRADALNSLAWLSQSLGDFDEAKIIAREALEIHRRLGNEWMESGILITLGSIAINEGELEESLKLQERALEIDLHWNSSFGQVASLNNIGRIYEIMRDFSKAVEYYEQSHELSKQLHFLDAQTATSGNLANCYSELEQHKKALSFVLEGIASAQKAGAMPRLVELGSLHGKLLRRDGKFTAAHKVLDEVLVKGEAIGNTMTVLGVRSQIGILFWAEKDYEQAKTTLEEMIVDARKYRIPMIIAEPLLYLGHCERDMGNTEDAIAAYRETVQQLEQVGGKLKNEPARANFQEKHREAYEELVKLLYSQNRNEEAWEVLGLMKSQEMRDLNSGTHSVPDDQQSRDLLAHADSLVSREALLMQKLNKELTKPEAEQRLDLLETWEAQLDTIIYAFENFVDELKDGHPDLYSRLEIEPVSFHTLQSSLQEGEAFVEPLLLPDKLIIFIVRGGTDPLVVREVPVNATEVDSLIVQMRASLSRPGRAWEKSRAKLATRRPVAQQKSSTEASEKLHELLIEPLERDLHGIETVILCPSGRLRYIPFAALYDGDSFLIDRFRTCVLTKAGVLANRGPIKAEASVLAFCNPDGSLNGAEREVHKLENIWNDTKIKTYCGDDATKTRLRREVRRHQILHLATHGVLLNNNPQGSYILLAGEGDGVNLTFREISLLSLSRVELAVLSACETAVGENGEGKEIAGLAYQFQDRGTASVIATLWAVDDESTADLMVELYSSLQEGEISRAEALHGAQMALRKSEKYSHPYYWAPFILIGSWR